MFWSRHAWLQRLYRHRIARFLVVGAMNTGLSYLTYALLLAAGLSYPVANLGSLLLGIFIAFQTQGRLVFGSAGMQRFPLFALAWAGIYGLNIGLIAVWMWAGLNAYVAGLVSLPMVVACSFVVQRYVVFRPPER